MKQTRGAGLSSRLYQQPNTPLKTVFEDSSSPEQDSRTSEKFEKLSRAPVQLQRDSASNGKRQRPRKLRVSTTLSPTSPSSSSFFFRTPSALLHNDWFLNQLFGEVTELYRSGSLTGVPLRTRPDECVRHLSLLRDLAPGCRINPLFPSKNRTSPERARAFYHSPDLLLSNNSNNKKTLPESDFLASMPPKRKASSSQQKKANSKQRRDALADETHVFSAKSKLIREDLTQLFASPLAWSSLSEAEREGIRTLLPPDTPYDEAGAPTQEFLRYDNDWRNHVRLFTEDVGAGRYEPAWLREAETASEARRRGDYDSWKEDQFEEFWGQKSDAHADLMAGEAVKVRLAEMVSDGLFRVGDVFVYIRHFGHGKAGYLVEKEATIVEISGSTLTFTMPPGMLRKPKQRGKVARSMLLPPTDEQPASPKFRSRSEEIKMNSPRLPSELQNGTRHRSNSTQSGNRGSVPPVSRSGDSTGGVEDDSGLRLNKKRFGIFGSFRRQSSSEEKESGTGGLFKLRRKPVAKMEIVPMGQSSNNVDDGDSDTPLSSLDSDDEDRYRAMFEPHNTSSTKKTAATRNRLVKKDPRDGAIFTSPDKHSFPRRPLPSRGGSTPAAQPAAKRRPSTSTSARSSASHLSTTPSRPPSRRGSVIGERTSSQSTDALKAKPGPKVAISRATMPQAVCPICTQHIQPNELDEHVRMELSASRRGQQQQQQQQQQQRERGRDWHTNANLDASSANGSVTQAPNPAPAAAKQTVDAVTAMSSSSINGNQNGTAVEDVIMGEGGPVSSLKEGEEDDCDVSLVTVSGVDSLHTLELKILQVDGRRKGEPRANAWRSFRCKRGDSDLGTLWNMREEYYKAKHR